MKIYHDHDEDGSWTEITTIKQYPTITTRMDETSQISFSLFDFEGALYATWEGYNFIPLKITDDSAVVLFQGFLTGKKYKHNKLSCVAHGLSVKLDWTPIHKNYVLAEGTVKNVPATVGTPTTRHETIVRPVADLDHSWSAPVGSAYAAINEVILTGTNGTRGVDEQINTENGDANAVCDMSCTSPAIDGTATFTDVTVHWEGEEDAGIGGLEVDISWDDGGSWEGAHEENMVPGWNWYSHTWTGFTKAEADYDKFAIRFTADAAVDATHNHSISVAYAVISYYVDEEAIDLQDADGDAFTWTADQYTSEVDTGILIRDTSSNWSSTTYAASAVAAADHTATTGNAASCQTKNDGDAFTITDTGIMDATGTITVSGDNIDSTTKKLKEIVITYNIAALLKNTTLDKQFILEILYNETTWKTIYKRQSYGDDGGIIIYNYNTHTITGTDTELAKYLTKTGDNYDGIDNIRVRLNSTASATLGCIGYVDYLKADIYYYDEDIAPVTEQIDENGASFIQCTDVDWTANGVLGETAPGEKDGDSFVIGVASSQVLYEVFGICGVGLQIDSTLTKYIGQHFKGTYGKEILKKIILLEGVHWFEDHVGNQVVIAAEADFVDSTEDLTQADYGPEWEFEDDNNYYKGVEVYGSAGYNIYYKMVDESIDSPRIKTIIEETIMTVPEARDVADKQLTELKTKRPSIKIPLIGTKTNLRIGKTTGLTMVRPTIAEADYPIRMIERSKFGGDIKTVIYCGLGHSTPQEKLANVINKSMYLSHKAHTDRLISTNFAPGASLSWSDISGATAQVNTLIAAADHDDLQNPNGNAEEQHLTSAQQGALHAKYTDAEAVTAMGVKGDANPLHHDIYSDADAVSAMGAKGDANPLNHDIYTDADVTSIVYAHFMIGTANSALVPATMVGGGLNTNWDTGAYELIRNEGANNMVVTLQCPIPTNRGGLKLYIKNILIGLRDADIYDYIDNFNLAGWSAFGTTAVIYNCPDNKTAPDEVDYATDDGAWAGPYDCSSYKAVVVKINCVNATAAAFGITYVLLDCYYDT